MLTATDYQWLAELFAAFAHLFVGTKDAEFYQYAEQRLKIKYPNFDAERFRKAYLDHRTLLDV